MTSEGRFELLPDLITVNGNPTLGWATGWLMSIGVQPLTPQMFHQLDWVDGRDIVPIARVNNPDEQADPSVVIGYLGARPDCVVRAKFIGIESICDQLPHVLMLDGEESA